MVGKTQWDWMAGSFRRGTYDRMRNGILSEMREAPVTSNQGMGNLVANKTANNMFV